MKRWYIYINVTGIYLNLNTKLFFEKDLPKFFFSFPEIQIAGILLCCDDDIVSLGDFWVVESKEFPDKPFDSISFDCVARLFTDSDPQPCYAQPVLFGNDNKVSRMMPFAWPI